MNRPVEVREIAKDSPEILIGRALASFLAVAVVMLFLWLFVA